MTMSGDTWGWSRCAPVVLIACAGLVLCPPAANAVDLPPVPVRELAPSNWRAVDPVSEVWFSGDGARVLLHSTRGAQIIDASDGRTLRYLAADDDTCVLVLPDASGWVASRDGAPEVWPRVNSAAFAPDGQSLVVRDLGHLVRVDLEGRQLAPVADAAKGPRVAVGLAAEPRFSAAGTRLTALVGTEQGTALVRWSLANGKVSEEFAFDPEKEAPFVLGPHGDHVVVAGTVVSHRPAAS